MQTWKVDIVFQIVRHLTVRTTLNLDDDILEIAAQQAQLPRLSLGKTVSDLVRPGLNSPTLSQTKDGLVVFRLPPDPPKITTDGVRQLESAGA